MASLLVDALPFSACPVRGGSDVCAMEPGNYVVDGDTVTLCDVEGVPTSSGRSGSDTPPSSATSIMLTLLGA
jgi:hypothetical protein